MTDPAYGLWSLVVINSATFIFPAGWDSIFRELIFRRTTPATCWR